MRTRRLLCVRNVKVARGVHGHADRAEELGCKVQLGAGGWAIVATETNRAVSRCQSQDASFGVQPEHGLVLAAGDKDVARRVGRDSAYEAKARGSARRFTGSPPPANVEIV